MYCFEYDQYFNGMYLQESPVKLGEFWSIWPPFFFASFPCGTAMGATFVLSELKHLEVIRK
jgi:hypothetical protein